MNDLLKFISNSLKPFGYHVRKYKAPNILRIAELESQPQIKALRKAQGGKYLTKDANLNHLVVYLRTCVRANRNIDLTQRLTQVPLEENTLRCLNSLIKALNYAADQLPGKTIEMIVMDDRSDETTQNKIKDQLAQARFKWAMKQTNETGQGPSLHQQFKEARDQNALVYFCEDDYLHEIDGIAAAWRFYEDALQKLGTHSLIYPQEHAVLYDDHYPSYLIAGPDRHWRTMRHATHTFITHGHVVRDFWDYFENTKFVGVKKKRKLGSEARTTNKLFNHIPGFSPLRPVAVHLQFQNTMPPLYEWRPLWEANKV